MADSGWHGTKEEWVQAEVPLLAIDADLQMFAQNYRFVITKNWKDWPERSLRKEENNVQCLIQVYLDDLETLELNVGVSAWQDRDDSRYWKNKILRKEVTVAEVSSELLDVLEEAKKLLDGWCSQPENLEFATKLSPPPKKT